MNNKLLVGLMLSVLLLSSVVSAASFDLRSSDKELVLEVDDSSDYIFGLWVGNDYFTISLLADGFKIGFDESTSVHHVVDMSIKDFGVFIVDLLMGGDMDRVGLLSTTFSVGAGHFVDMAGLGVGN